jgi:hypothetical protein
MTQSPAQLWQAGYGPIVHRPETIQRAETLLHRPGIDEATLFGQLAAATG